jgi:hypothetical protein
MRARLLALALATIAGLTIFASTGASAQGIQLFAVLNGGNECNPTGTCRVGDLDAFGAAAVIFPTGNKVCFAIVANDLTGATVAHIHRGAAGVKGDIVVTLKAPSAPSAGDPGASSGCATPVSTNIVGQIKGNPSGFYINVHNAGFPDGAIRGQLF